MNNHLLSFIYGEVAKVIVKTKKIFVEDTCILNNTPDRKVLKQYIYL